MVRAEPTNTRTAGIDTNHSTTFTLLLEQRYVGKGGYSSNCKIVLELLPLMAKYTLPFSKSVKSDQTTIWYIQNNHIKTNSQCDPVLMRQFKKKLQSDPVPIRSHLCRLVRNLPLSSRLPRALNLLNGLGHRSIQFVLPCWLHPPSQ